MAKLQLQRCMATVARNYRWRRALRLVGKTSHLVTQPTQWGSVF
ncbi:hypothetical protein [Loigolactobacillus rennini]|uniref:Uncharacterized protein n=1 Tax=Loigolactobacillus rennini TaxID=238013 RepID=A0A1K2I9L6_9LACO|nr:hypothetical protein [Loigolactobacillus rennini]SFZ89061.1 hypothetical protein LREN565_2174 [Loigolactobacillus rennini]